ncbi:MAG: hypothetical protein AB1651_09460 [Pseudomonadota bacterium]
MADVRRATATGAVEIGVRSSSKVKDYHLEDRTTQRHVIEKAGLKVRCLRLAHVDTRFAYRGLLTEKDLMPQTEPLRELVPRRIAGALCSALIGNSYRRRGPSDTRTMPDFRWIQPLTPGMRGHSSPCLASIGKWWHEPRL